MMMSRNSAARKQAQTANEHQQQLLSRIRAFGYAHRTGDVFADFVEMAALAMSNAVDWHQREAREARYLDLIGKYRPEEVARFPQMLGALTLAYEERVQLGDFGDLLGETYMRLKLGNDRAGQYFTPYHVSKLMAMMNVGDGSPHIEQCGFLTLHEPACGAGGMVIACADVLHASGRNRCCISQPSSCTGTR
ncbi:hypothetical protein OR16_04532 [Cupriavidus basilensis OR16]|uniref:DNA methylase adenine-specific domain-containing protein n=1 Tax=Cupriavidus basilensis OR16 TaxID=1127483 RepID=H1RZZ8_9BURK|nr:N-6 DNA methylase [Cupriavidus basilensis]EHP44214.1 hypothetical protein OR16_04532 [Cupriavidus basilensis OR16]